MQSDETNPFFAPPSPTSFRGRPRRYHPCLGSVRLSDINKKLIRGFRKWFRTFFNPSSAKFWPSFLNKEKGSEGYFVYSQEVMKEFYREPRFKSIYLRWLKKVFLKYTATTVEEKKVKWYAEYLVFTRLGESDGGEGHD